MLPIIFAPVVIEAVAIAAGTYAAKKVIDKVLD